MNWAGETAATGATALARTERRDADRFVSEPTAMSTLTSLKTQERLLDRQAANSIRQQIVNRHHAAGASAA